MRTPSSRSRSLLLTGAAALGAGALVIGVATSSNASAAGVRAGGAFSARAATTTPHPTPRPTPTTKPVPKPPHPAPSRTSVMIDVKVSGRTTSGVYHGMLTATLTSGKAMLSGERLTLHARHDARAAWKVAGQALSAPKTGRATFVLTQRAGTDQYEVTLAATATYAAATSSVITVHRH